MTTTDANPACLTARSGDVPRRIVRGSLRSRSARRWRLRVSVEQAQPPINTAEVTRE